MLAAVAAPSGVAAALARWSHCRGHRHLAIPAAVGFVTRKVVGRRVHVGSRRTHVRDGEPHVAGPRMRTLRSEADFEGHYRRLAQRGLISKRSELQLSPLLRNDPDRQRVGRLSKITDAQIALHAREAKCWPIVRTVDPPATHPSDGRVERNRPAAVEVADQRPHGGRDGVDLAVAHTCGNYGEGTRGNALVVNRRPATCLRWCDGQVDCVRVDGDIVVGAAGELRRGPRHLHRGRS